jgi:hypothetical protein
MQHRGSLHAHILLWVDDADLARVTAEITATRCKYKNVGTPDAPNYVPDLPQAAEEQGSMSAALHLLLLVDRKQIHRCRDSVHGCRHNRHDCRYGFPFSPNHAGTTFDDATNRSA